MKFKNKISLVLITILIILLFVVQITIIPSTNAKKLADPELLKGDIVQIHYTCFDNEKFWNYHYWSHTVLYIDNDDYIHSTLHDGVHLSNGMTQILHEIESNPNWNYAILRVTYNQKDIEDVIDFAELRIDERGYDLFSLLIPPFIGMKQIDGPWWTPNYSYYCTELVWAAYINETGINLDDNNFGWINPLEIYYSSHIIEKYTLHEEDIPSLK